MTPSAPFGWMFGCCGCESEPPPPPCDPQCIMLAGYPCPAPADYIIEIHGPSGFAYTGPAKDFTQGCTGTVPAWPCCLPLGDYTWEISGWPAEYIPTATSGTFKIQCKGGWPYAYLSPALSFNKVHGAEDICPCGDPGPGLEGYLPIHCTGTRTLTWRGGSVTLDAYPGVGSFSIDVLYNNIAPFSSHFSFDNVWAGIQRYRACSAYLGCCDNDLVNTSNPPSRDIDLLWIFDQKTCRVYVAYMVCTGGMAGFTRAVADIPFSTNVVGPISCPSYAGGVAGPALFSVINGAYTVGTHHPTYYEWPAAAADHPGYSFTGNVFGTRVYGLCDGSNDIGPITVLD